MDLIPPSFHIMDMGEVDLFEKRLQEAFPNKELHAIIDVDGRAEIWSGDLALGVKWVSTDPAQLISLPQSISPRKLSDILYDMVYQEVEKIVNQPQEGVENGV